MPLWKSVTVLLVSAVGTLVSVRSEAAEFFAGKTVTFLASSEPGAGYDTYTRLLAKSMQKYIPGKPIVVVQNEPGGGGLKVAQDLYAVEAKDGTKIGNLRASTMLDSILGIRASQIDPRKYEWLGNMASDTDLCAFWYTSGVHSFSDLLKKQVIVGASGKGAQNWSFTNAINSILHTKMKIIAGYKGMGDRVIAEERGELQGNCGTNASSMISAYPKQLAEKKIIPIMQSGLHPYSAFPDVPLTQSFAKNEDDRRTLVAIFSQMQIARTFAVPPGTPKGRVAVLRTAFMKAMKDPDMLQGAKQARLNLNPMSGEETAAVIAQMADITPGLKAKVKAAIGD